ncbi:MoaD/ThiS family protein [Mycobacterium avium subsp. paratuberculosis]|uniref:MoaD/ThiS family protein n=1 Tax=Mycobacterium avium TaxID=1764 RepID=UPI0002A6BFDE|nr:MoaD/ThiS family protein [Mycobacterium avium]ELP47437.1 MoaD2 [Mycobacterium avium subsp. paratuberculosis S5]ETB28612.1 molybdenum cofactor biosynthesis protein MoaD [Mycobacterium avium subsp. paratuberculosis 10-5975]AZA68332.1 MoaD/ThiS family protein [Mycobacterium avium subsp. paratuberculosis]AZB13174.1 MoaD/ThiS family protein [Mycobacterium avium subsp. paratuberculosis]AZB37202.1 MoaD/ThiS family protein [Mycobacterium avium subsp. paratuberculosis]
MGRVPVQANGISVTVRYFAAARAAAGAESETVVVVVRPGTTVGELVERLAVRGSRLAEVLSRCSYLCDGIAVRDETQSLRSGDTIDVLPPFSGG